MACHVQDKTVSDVLELLATEGFEGMAQEMSLLLDEAMRLAARMGRILSPPRLPGL